jgi:hypothetical protein
MCVLLAGGEDDGTDDENETGRKEAGRETGGAPRRGCKSDGAEDSGTQHPVKVRSAGRTVVEEGRSCKGRRAHVSPTTGMRYAGAPQDRWVGQARRHDACPTPDHCP